LASLMLVEDRYGVAFHRELLEALTRLGLGGLPGGAARPRIDPP
jgi:hypothetical protein